MPEQRSPTIWRRSGGWIRAMMPPRCSCRPRGCRHGRPTGGWGYRLSTWFSRRSAGSTTPRWRIPRDGSRRSGHTTSGIRSLFPWRGRPTPIPMSWSGASATARKSTSSAILIRRKRWRLATLRSSDDVRFRVSSLDRRSLDVRDIIYTVSID